MKRPAGRATFRPAARRIGPRPIAPCAIFTGRTVQSPGETPSVTDAVDRHLRRGHDDRPVRCTLRPASSGRRRRNSHCPGCRCPRRRRRSRHCPGIRGTGRCRAERCGHSNPGRRAPGQFRPAHRGRGCRRQGGRGRGRCRLGLQAQEDGRGHRRRRFVPCPSHPIQHACPRSGGSGSGGGHPGRAGCR